MGDPSHEGWYTDPFARHEARWLSDGTPTTLIRDDGVEGHDEPPDGPFVQEAERIEPAPARSDTLRRADDAERAGDFDPEKLVRAAWDAFDQTSGTGGFL
jgi:hypothetical protein